MVHVTLKLNSFHKWRDFIFVSSSYIKDVHESSQKLIGKSLIYKTNSPRMLTFGTPSDIVLETRSVGFY